MKIWGWRCSRYLCSHGFFLCEKFQCLKLSDRIVHFKKTFFEFSWNAQFCLTFMNMSSYSNDMVFKINHIISYCLFFCRILTLLTRSLILCVRQAGTCSMLKIRLRVCLQIWFLIWTEFKRTDNLLFPMKLSENLA